jgi:F subunit of K+-transporting ATPase (Potass_KdpF)
MLLRSVTRESIHGRYLLTTGDRGLCGGDARTYLGLGARMNVTQDILLAISVVMFLYIGYAMFKPEKF